MAFFYEDKKQTLLNYKQQTFKAPLLYGKIAPLFRSFLWKALLLLALLWVGGSLLFSRNGIITHFRLENENQNTQNSIDSLELEIQRTTKSIELLQSDTFAIESIARTKFGYTLPGEETYIFKVVE